MSRPKTKSNVALLTEGAAYIARAKKARREQVEEIKFDDEARREWLTGFSKRKKAKVEEKRARAKERDHQAHLQDRRQARQDLRQRAAENVKSIRKAMGLEDYADANNEDDDEDDDDEDEGAEAGPSTRGEIEEAEFSDEDQLATVTIMENFDPSSTTHIYKARQSSTTPEPQQEEKPKPKPTVNAKSMIGALPPSSGRLQKAREKKKEEKQKSRSMETKAERKKGREIEGRRRTQKAALAYERDGKSRGKGGGRGAKGGARGRGGRGKR
ncbi:hypothetical protein CI109_100527 [Kwoniella shandongensis]|uniref:Uncharacterized protein n=1 Tax=Kwoniella shandongensis TaxID=1734106 RepID=A0A5M6BZT3_9TREE|nr:uncharacterized protein CI109_003552 [Kwoniella shandongensis]KAA5528263.1 hypothetical protein CI109_003552 [Kwoniella shandongensis]